MIGFGQEKSFELGLLFGSSQNSLNGDSEFTKNVLWPTGGFLAEYNFNNHLSIKSKLTYHIKGGKTLKQFAGGVEHGYRLDLHYLTLPLLAQVNFGKNKWRVFSNTGLYLGQLMKVENIYDPKVKVSNPTPYTVEKFNKLDFGLILGSGLSFQMSEITKIFLELSFEHSLSNTYLLESKDIVLTQAITGAVGITYNFPTKKKTFNGISELKCAEYNEDPSTTKEKKKSKWRLVLYKDGKKIGGKSRKGKSRLFKNKK